MAALESKKIQLHYLGAMVVGWMVGGTLAVGLLYAANLARLGRAPVARRVATLGVFGFLLGLGLMFFGPDPKWGLLADRGMGVMLGVAVVRTHWAEVVRHRPAPVNGAVNIAWLAALPQFVAFAAVFYLR